MHNSNYLYQTIMLIDDNRIDTILSKKVLENEKVAENIVAFTNAPHALDYLHSIDINQPDNIPAIIFLDVIMPEMNGLEFIKKFAELPGSMKEKIRILLLSGSVLSQEQKDEVEKYHTHIAYLSKPITKDNLKKLL